MSDHPPIPPGCEFVVPRNDKEDEYLTIINSCFCCPTPKERLVISSIMRCAWLDEAEKFDLMDLADPKVECATFESAIRNPIAFENAAAWKEWGRK